MRGTPCSYDLWTDLVRGYVLDQELEVQVTVGRTPNIGTALSGESADLGG